MVGYGRYLQFRFLKRPLIIYNIIIIYIYYIYIHSVIYKYAIWLRHAQAVAARVYWSNASRAVIGRICWGMLRTLILAPGAQRISTKLLITGLAAGEIYGKPLFSPSNIGVSSNFSLKPIQWNEELVMIGPYLSYWRAMLLALAIMDMLLELLFLISWLLGCYNPYWAMVCIPCSGFMTYI